MKLLKSLLPMYIPVICLFLGLTLLGDRAVTAAAENRPLPRSRCFIIDAGHGGEDGGTVSCTGVYESRINLEIAKRLESLLHLLGQDTVMTRSADEALSTQGNTVAARKLADLKSRVRLVNSVPNGILISIHQNQFPQARYSGPQVFWGSRPGSQPLARILQQRLNKGLQLSGGRSPGPAKRVYLMQQVQTPAVLIECGFLSNPKEEALLRSGAYQQRLSAILAAALAEYP